MPGAPQRRWLATVDCEQAQALTTLCLQLDKAKAANLELQEELEAEVVGGCLKDHYLEGKGRHHQHEEDGVSALMMALGSL